ncbi:hypothetical protein Hypma_013873 [Hypsizygus marmoreus]|uniref:Uncharacterized protein n=1 Tax=Hypsizygus marmoreus TaxID=39966 RepID=A0A369KAX1_HYPMA|nr:hypothetical protein Hypma_013873 [Hypsizygus marmoreus]
MPNTVIQTITSCSNSSSYPGYEFSGYTRDSVRVWHARVRGPSPTREASNWIPVHQHARRLQSRHRTSSPPCSRRNPHHPSLSCGYAVPFFTYKAPRNRLLTHFTRHELADIEAEAKLEFCSTPPHSENGLKQYWVIRNAKSPDGPPGALLGFECTTRFKSPKRNLQQGDETERIGW